MCILRRFLLLWLFMFWQGGFVFYAAVVVTVGATIHGDFAQGLITRQVALALNVTGFLVLLTWTADLLAERTSRVKRRFGAWLFLLLTVAALAWLHPQMAALIDTEQRTLVDGDRFHHLHRWYLRTSTAQWLASLAFTLWTLQNWREADRASTSGP
jgi:hypothetical protein